MGRQCSQHPCVEVPRTCSAGGHQCLCGIQHLEAVAPFRLGTVDEKLGARAPRGMVAAARHGKK